MMAEVTVRRHYPGKPWIVKWGSALYPERDRRGVTFDDKHEAELFAQRVRRDIRTHRAGQARARGATSVPPSRKARWDAVHANEKAGNPITNARGFVFLGEPARHRR